MGRKVKKRKRANTMREVQQQIHAEVEKATATNKKKLRRKRVGITGVAAGLGEYFNIDPTWVRIGLVAGTIFTTGALLIPYLIMAFVLPKESDPLPFDQYQIEYGEDWPLFSDDLPESLNTQEVCYNCDTVMRHNAKYCPHCGAKL